MSNQPRMSAVLVAESEQIEDVATLIIDADGTRTEPELYLLSLISNHTHRTMVHDLSDAIAEAADGPMGVLGVRAQRLIREAARDFAGWPNHPDPAGPAQAKAA